MMCDRWQIMFCDLPPLVAGAPVRNRVLYWLLTHTLKPGYRHCFAVRPSTLGDGYIVANCGSVGSGVYELTLDEYVAWLEANGILVASLVSVRAEVMGKAIFRGPLTCVTSVAHLLGCKSQPWWTPYKLYKTLKQQEL